MKKLFSGADVAAKSRVKLQGKFVYKPLQQMLTTMKKYIIYNPLKCVKPISEMTKKEIKECSSNCCDKIVDRFELFSLSDSVFDTRSLCACVSAIYFESNNKPIKHIALEAIWMAMRLMKKMLSHNKLLYQIKHIVDSNESDSRIVTELDILLRGKSFKDKLDNDNLWRKVFERQRRTKR